MTVSLPNQSPSFEQIRYGISVAISLVFLGWALAMYQMPLWGWGLTLLCLVHLCRSGRSAIPLSLAWTNLVVWVAAFRYATPVGFVWRNAKYWSASLIFLWGMATVIVLAIAKVPKLFPNHHHAGGWLPACLMSGGLAVGFMLYYQGLAPQ